MAKTIKHLLKNFIDTPQDWKITLVKQWHSIFGHLSTHITLEKIYKDTIVLGVYDSCWLQELYLLSPTLIKAINATLDQPYIKQVRFKTVGHKEKKEIKEKKPMIIKNITLSNREKEILKKIQDPQLQSALKAFLIRCYQEK